MSLLRLLPNAGVLSWVAGRGSGPVLQGQADACPHQRQLEKEARTKLFTAIGTKASPTNSAGAITPPQ